MCARRDNLQSLRQQIDGLGAALAAALAEPVAQTLLPKASARLIRRQAAAQNDHTT